MKAPTSNACAATSAVVGFVWLLCSIQTTDSCAAVSAAAAAAANRIQDFTVSLDSQEQPSGSIDSEEGGGQPKSGVGRHGSARLRRGLRAAPLDAGGQLSLSEECCRADDCDPGLFTVSVPSSHHHDAEVLQVPSVGVLVLVTLPRLLRPSTALRREMVSRLFLVLFRCT